MSVNQSNNNLSYGLNNALQSANPEYIFALRAPTSSDSAPFGTFWFYKVSSTEVNMYIFTSASLWIQIPLGAQSPVFDGLTVDGDTALNGALTVNSGSSAIAIGTDAVAKTITLGNVTGATAVNINTGTAGSTITTTNGTFGVVTGTGAINIGADAVAKTITIGNGTGGTSVVINNGTGALNIGTNAIAHIMTLGNVTGATAVNVNTGTAGSTVTTTNGVFAVATGTGAINLGTDAVAKTITVGNNTGATALVFNAGTGLSSFNSGVATAPVNSNVATAAFVASLTAGTSVHNTTGYDLLCNITLIVSSATTATITLGVGSATGPTTNTVVPSFSSATSIIVPIVAWVPNNYYLVYNTTGTITVASATVQSCPL